MSKMHYFQKSPSDGAP